MNRALLTSKKYPKLEGIEEENCGLERPIMRKFWLRTTDHG